jgi:DNA-binding transcriptional regulator YiaG
MPNLGNVLKDEVVRLCRKELRKELGPVRKITTAHRRDLAALKRHLAEAQRRIQLLERQAARSGAARPLRFVAKGLRSMRQRLGLSAADLARLIQVSEQSVYNWETKKTTPRREQVQALAALRGLGKREAHAQLDKMPKPK